MHLNTPHLVFTTKHLIVLGYEQHAAYVLRNCTLLHGKLLMNTDQGKTRTLLIRMMQYVYKCPGVESNGECLCLQAVNIQLKTLHKKYSKGHIPDLTDKEFLVDILTLINFCMLINVRNFHTYSFWSTGPMGLQWHFHPWSRTLHVHPWCMGPLLSTFLSSSASPLNWVNLQLVFCSTSDFRRFSYQWFIFH